MLAINAESLINPFIISNIIFIYDPPTNTFYCKCFVYYPDKSQLRGLICFTNKYIMIRRIAKPPVFVSLLRKQIHVFVPHCTFVWTNNTDRAQIWNVCIINYGKRSSRQLGPIYVHCIAISLLTRNLKFRHSLLAWTGKFTILRVI